RRIRAGIRLQRPPADGPGGAAAGRHRLARARLPQPEAVLPRTPVAPVADPAPVLVAEGSEPAPPVVAPIAGPVADMGPPAGPMAGVRLEYLHAPAPDY